MSNENPLLPYLEKGKIAILAADLIVKRVFEWRTETAKGMTVDLIDLDKVAKVRVATSADEEPIIEIWFGNGPPMKEKVSKALANNFLDMFRAYHEMK